MVVTEKSRARDSKSLETLGHYNPTKDPIVLSLNEERIQYWIGQGAQPSETVRRLMTLKPEDVVTIEQRPASEPVPRAEAAPAIEEPPAIDEAPASDEQPAAEADSESAEQSEPQAEVPAEAAGGTQAQAEGEKESPPATEAQPPTEPSADSPAVEESLPRKRKPLARRSPIPRPNLPRRRLRAA